MRASVQMCLRLSFAAPVDLSSVTGVLIRACDVGCPAAGAGCVASVDARLKPRDCPAWEAVEIRAMAATMISLRMGAYPSMEVGSDYLLAGGRRMILAHLHQAGAAAVAIDQAENRPHDQTPLSISGQDCAAVRFRDVFAGSKK